MVLGWTLPTPLPLISMADECRGAPGSVMVGALVVPIWMKRTGRSPPAAAAAARILSALGPQR